MSDANGIGSLTQAEQDYLNSGGQNSEGLLKELQPNGAAAAAATPAEAPKPAEKPADAPAKPADAAAALAVDPAAQPPAAAATPGDEPEVGEEEVATPDGKGKRRMVDSRALKQARAQAKDLATKLEEERQARIKDNEARAVVNERLRLLTEAVQAAPADEPAAPAQPATPAPTPQTDIIAWADNLNKTIEELNGKIGQISEQTAEERAQTTTIRNYHQDAAAFAQRTPDFKAAYDHLFGLRKRQLEIQGYTPEQVNKFIFDEEMNHVTRSIAANKSPSEGLYELAKLAGYAPKPAPAAAVPAAAPTNGHAVPGNGATAPAAAAAAAAPAVAAVPSVTEEIERIQKGQPAARSLSSGAGGGGDELSLETLAKMSMADFERMYNKDPKALERAMGRTN